MSIGEHEVKAKDTSHVAMIVGAGWIFAATVLKALGVFAIEETDIISSGLSVIAVFSPVYANMIITNLRGLFKGD
jgi:uncharacterized membrane protein